MTVSQYLTETRIFAGVCLYSSLQRRVNIDYNEAVDTGIQGGGDWMTGRASNEGSRRFHNHGEGPGAFFWLKAPTCALTLKTLVRAEKNGKVATI